MKRRPTGRDWLPLARTDGKAVEAPTGEAFCTEWIDFEKGIRVGNLEPHERITQILKYGLEQRYGTPFITDRWGRGTFWQWICWVPRADREAKPISSGTNFGCAKLFISQDREARVFQCGMTVERGYVRGRPSIPGIILKTDWDWHRLVKQCASGSALDAELRRLVIREGFHASVTSAKGTTRFTRKNFKGAGQVRSAARAAPEADWAGFSLFYPMPEKEVRSSSGFDLVQGILGAFAEVTPAMNLCMQIRLQGLDSLPNLRSPSS